MPVFNYRRLLLAQRSIAVAGDDYERLALPVLSVEFPEYELLWKFLVLDVTNNWFTPQRRYMFRFQELCLLLQPAGGRVCRHRC